jgi:hypothetical protein
MLGIVEAEGTTVCKLDDWVGQQYESNNMCDSPQMAFNNACRIKVSAKHEAQWDTLMTCYCSNVIVYAKHMIRSWGMVCAGGMTVCRLNPCAKHDIFR